MANRRLRATVGALALLSASFPSLARAQCCTGYSPATVCTGSETKSRWCIQNTVPDGQTTLPPAFCAYGDKVIATLEDVFNIPAGEVFEFELDTRTGGAHTGTACRNLGAGVAYDAFKGNAYGTTGFWGYLLSLHEAINVWTGKSSSGWPTDWWADHQSAFPNLMDFHIMETIGTANSDQNLLKAAAAQKKRFYPGGDSADPKVVALDNVFASMPGGNGFSGFSEMFSMQSGDGVKWDSLGVPNPDVKRSEYVVAYMSLAARQRVLSVLQGPGKDGGGEICNGTDNGAGDAPYTCSEARIDAIATAHCSIAANGKPQSGLQALRAGNFDAVPSGPCGNACPEACACDGEQHCVAKWLVAPPAACAAGEFCAFEPGLCGRGPKPGVCRTKPPSCPPEHSPVCGCDGKAHDGACAASAAGVDLDVTGRCDAVIPDFIPCGAFFCDAKTSYCEIYLSDVFELPSRHRCRELPAPCWPGEGPKPSCVAFPETRRACRSADRCPRAASKGSTSRARA